MLASACAAPAEVASLRAEQRLLARRLADTRADLHALRTEVSRLRGRIDDLGYRRRLSTGGPAGEEWGSAEGRTPEMPRRSEARAPAAGVRPPGAPPAAAPAPGGPDLAGDLARAEDADFRAGLQYLQRGDSGRAIQSLRRFVSRHPKDGLVPAAQYWIGESYFAQEKYNEAILAYNEILTTWPESDRVPAALLRQAAAFAKLGDRIDARLILQKLISEHPKSPEAARAKAELRALGG